MLDDADIRRMVLYAIPDIDPDRLEICMVDYDAAVGWWLRDDFGYKETGRAIAINRTEKEIAAEIAGDITTRRCGTVIDDIPIQIAPDEPMKAPAITNHEGRAGRHPKNCTCSKHRK